MLRAYFIFIIVIIQFSTLLFAQVQFVNIQNLTTDHGLVSNGISEIAQDSSGYIWFGTSLGLSRFDGYGFTNYQKSIDDSTSIISNTVWEIYVDRDSTVWICFDGSGLSRYRKEYNDFVNYNKLSQLGLQPDDEKENISISGFYEHDSSLFAVNTIGSIFKYSKDADTFVQVYKNQYTAGGNVKRIFKTESTLYLGGRNILFSLDLKTYQLTNHVDHINLRTGDEIWAIERHNDELWFGTLGSGLHIYNLSTGDSDNFFTSTQVSGIYDFSNDYYVVCSLQGLMIMDKQTKQIHPVDTDKIESPRMFFQDNTGNYWIGHTNAGVSYVLNNKKFNLLESTNTSSVESIEPIRNQHVLVGATNGMVQEFNAQMEFLQEKNVSGGPVIMEIFEDSKGRFWLGAYKAGLIQFNKNLEVVNTYLPNPNDETSISGDDVRAIAEDKNGHLWLAVHGGGVNSFNPENETFTHYGTYSPKGAPYQLYDDWPFTLFIDGSEVLWIGHPSGLARMNQDSTFTYYTHNPDDSTTISNSQVLEIFEDNENNLWIGTNEGLNVFNRATETFTSYTTKDGLIGNRIQGITEDMNGNIWVTTTEGISKFNKDSISFTNYTSGDGFISNEFNADAAEITSDGTIILGSKQGAIYFKPSEIKENAFKPPVFITDFKLFNQNVPVLKNTGHSKSDEKQFYLEKHISQLDKLVLDYKQNVLTFNYVALNYIQPEENKYAYKMEGFDDDWYYVGNKREATYTGLQPGKYIFRVIASNNDDVWNKVGASLTIIITPPWWRTWWFYSISGILLIGIIILLLRLREKQLQRDKNVLKQKLDEGYKEINEQKEIVRKQQEEIKQRDIAEHEMKWYNQGLAKFSDIISRNRDDFKKLCQAFISELVKYTETEQGTIYIYIEDNEKHLLKLMGSVYLDSKRIRLDSISVGENMTGTAFKEGKIMTVNDLPEDFSVISSGLGRKPIKCIAIVPVLLDDFKEGVIELTSFNPMPEYMLKFVQKIGETMASVIANWRAKTELEKVVNVSKAQQEELQSQEEELRQNMEEMQASREEMERKEVLLLKKIESLEQEIQHFKKARTKS